MIPAIGLSKPPLKIVSANLYDGLYFFLKGESVAWNGIAADYTFNSQQLFLDSYNGTPSNSAVHSPRNGASLNFNNSVYFKTYNNNYNFDGDLTVSFWIYRKDTATDYIFMSGDADENIPFYCYCDATNLHVGHRHSSGTDYGSHFSYFYFTANTWHHITVTRVVGSHLFTLYVNGNLNSKLSYNYSPSQTFALMTLGNASIGMIPLNAYMNNFGVWNKALNANEAKFLYQSTYPF